MNTRRLHPFDANWQAAIGYRSQRPLFNDMDYIRGKGSLTEYTIGEVAEAVAELEVSGKPDSEKVADELNDVFNMMVTVTVLTEGKDFRPRDYLYNVNGDGKHSNAFEKLTETIADSEHDTAAIIESFRLLWSIGMHGFERDPDRMVAQVIRTYQKVSSNYPVELYNGTDPMTGELLQKDEDKEAVFSHVTKSLKTIRATVDRALRPTDVQPVKQLVSNWVDSAAAVSELQQRMKEAEVVRESGIVIPSAETTVFITQKSGILFDSRQSKAA